MIADLTRFDAAIAQFDAINSKDPNTEIVAGEAVPKELLYAQRMSARLHEFATNASEELQLAARSQHIRRWASPRSDFPMDRRGYLRWRTSLYRFHADTAGAIMRQVGYEDAAIERVQTLLRKEQLKRDADVQCLEDVICLVFLEHYLADFASQQDEDKLVTIIQRTWKKMSTQGHEAALQLGFSPKVRLLLDRALSSS